MKTQASLKKSMYPFNTPHKAYLSFIGILLLFNIITSCKKDVSSLKHNSSTSVDSVPALSPPGAPLPDLSPVDIDQATKIYHAGYIDQPYILKLSNGSWICFYTKSPINEGSAGETIGISVSTDKGVSWQYQGDLEPASGPDAFYAVPFLNANGRIYVIYGYNYDNIAYGPTRHDMVGKMCYRYSDDNGKTWSARSTVEIPVTHIDLVNYFHDNGVHQVWWAIDKPILSNDGNMYFAFTKTGNFDTHEGFIVNSPNINTETDVSKIKWNFTPTGANGISSPVMGPVQEEFNIRQLSSGGFICFNRTARGYPAVSYSQDNCKTWSVPVPATYAYGDTIRTPRACARIFKCSNGKYLLWFHNNSFVAGHRNPVWLSGGIESNGVIKWSQPEMILFSQTLTYNILISYPDLVEDNGNYYLTETQKKDACINKINPKLLDMLWNQGQKAELIKDHLVVDYTPPAGSTGTQTLIFKPGTKWSGASVEIKMTGFNANGNLAECKAADGSKLMTIVARSNGGIGMDLYNGNNVVLSYDCDPKLINRSPTAKNVISFMLDNKSHVLSSMINGVLCNGDYIIKQGWQRIPALFTFKAINAMYVNSDSVNEMRVFDIGMHTSEMISEYNYFRLRN
jgi:hypothetical protein